MEGIFYFFNHRKKGHTLVLGDAPQVFVPNPTQPQVPYRPQGGTGEREQSVTDWQVMEQLRSSTVTLRDYHFEMPEKSLEVSRPSAQNGPLNGKLEIFDYPGDYAQRINRPADPRLGQLLSEGDRTVKVRMEEEEAPHQVANGASDCQGFSAGFTFRFTNPPAGSSAGPYVLTGVNHSARQGSAFTSGATFGGSYSNSFGAIPLSVPFRPSSTTPKPVIHGPQTAVVVGPPGEEIHVDQYGRIKVQFHWDRLGKKNERSSCWMRVAQLWAGKQWGASFWPRVGQEVIVDFLEGDPDQPIVVGSVYNAHQMPPYLSGGPDPKHKYDPNVSGIKTCTTPGGGGFNELRFNDTKGKEQVFLRSQGNLDVHVNGSDMTSIGGDYELTVERNVHEKVNANKELLVAGNMLTKVSAGKYDLDVSGDLTQFVGSNACIAAGAECEIGGKRVYIRGTDILTLESNGNYITIDGGGIWIQGSAVHINEGGPLASKFGPTTDAPADPQGADDAKPGFPSNT